MADTSASQTLATQANQAYQDGDFENAARLFGETASALKTAGNELEAAEMKNNQSVAYLQAGNARLALEAATGTPDIFANAGDARRQGIALANEATPLESLGRQDEAITRYRQAAEAFQKADEDQLRYSVMQAIAWIQLRRFKILPALVDLYDGLSTVKHPTFKQKIMRALLRSLRR
jgi:tetratricopeptide (TPR) repeat protein